MGGCGGPPPGCGKGPLTFGLPPGKGCGPPQGCCGEGCSFEGTSLQRSHPHNHGGKIINPRRSTWDAVGTRAPDQEMKDAAVSLDTSGLHQVPVKKRWTSPAPGEKAGLRADSVS